MTKEKTLQIVDAVESGYTNTQIMGMFNLSYDELVEILGPLGLNEDYVDKEAWRLAKKQAFKDEQEWDVLDSETILMYHRKAYLKVMRQCRLNYFELVFEYKDIDVARLKVENNSLLEKLAAIRKLVI